MEAVEHVEKVRVNPGNYADKKKFAVREYSDADYDRELARLHEAFSPLVLRAKALGRSLRIGTNHGSLSDRIMNRHGDTPLGMVESALEFVRICESHRFHDLILSMKASNPKVMIQAYRLLVARMDAVHRPYPLHLGVTEAGDGEDGRIKSAIGIGSLLLDGLGDTIRVSLTEDSVYEIPVAQALAKKAMALWTTSHPQPPASNVEPAEISAMNLVRSRSDVEHCEPVSDDDSIDPFHFTKRETATLTFGEHCIVGREQPPRVIVRVTPAEFANPPPSLRTPSSPDTPVEGILVPITTPADLAVVVASRTEWKSSIFLVFEVAPILTSTELGALLQSSKTKILLVRSFAAHESETLRIFAKLVRRYGHFLACSIAPADVSTLGDTLRALGTDSLVFIPGSERSASASPIHSVGTYRQLAGQLNKLGMRAPIWIRNTADTAIGRSSDFLSRLLDASILTGALLCDGFGDLVSIETEPDPARATRLTYNVLQGSGARSSKTEFVACPSCGRTLFDLQTTTQRIRARTGHLKGVKIAIMGCIVNGPGEMADADFGYVGGAPGKINLYVGKQCVQYNLPQAEADERLIVLIREQGKWIDPVPAPGSAFFSSSPLVRDATVTSS